MDVYRSLTAECMECPHCTGYPCIDGCVKDWIDENVQKAAGVPGEWYYDDYIGGYYDSAGRFVRYRVYD